MVLDYIEFDNLMEELTHRFTKANVDGTLYDLLAKLGWETLLSNEVEPLNTFEYGKILVIGEQTVDIDKLRMTVRKLGLDLSRFEFSLDYEAAQTFNYGKLAYNTNYRVILIGATPHSTTGTGHSGRVLSELQSHPDKYPRVCPLYTEEGQLKITKSNFRKALETGSVCFPSYLMVRICIL